MSLFLLSGDVEFRPDPAGADPNLEIKQATVSNTETPTPVTVGHYARHYAPPYDFASENAAIYCRIDHRPGETDARNWFYGEITEQSLVGGSITKVIHRGKGDAHYVAIMGDNLSGFGYEAAMFGGWQDAPTDTIPKQENGYLASLQGAGGFQESVKNQANSVGFHALVHDDGVDPTDPDAWTTAYGLFYANNSLNNAFVARRSEYAPSGYSHYKLMDHNLRPLWQVMDDGASMLIGEEATVGSPNQPSPSQSLRGYYWTGSAEQANQTKLTHTTAGAGLGALHVHVGNPGAETLALQVTEDGTVAAAGHVRTNGNSKYIGWAGKSLMYSTVNGDILLTNWSANDFNLLQLGGQTSASPALGISGPNLAARLADDSAYTGMEVSKLVIPGAADSVISSQNGIFSFKYGTAGNDIYLNANPGGVNQIYGTGAAADLSLGANGANNHLTIKPSGVVEVAGDTFGIRTNKTPASASATGTTGDIAWDSGFLYVCTATDTWKRAALTTWS